MALNNLANLKAEMRDWAIDRPDLIPKFQDCIDLAVNDLNKVLRARQQYATTQLTLDANGVAPLPADYLEWRAVTALTNPKVGLVPLTPEGETKVYPNSYGGFPANFVVENDTITILPVTTSPIELKYWKKIPRLVETPPGDTNWVLQENPNLILFGAMKYVEVYKRNANGMQIFGGLYSGLIDGMIKETKRSQWSRLRARVSGRSTP
jgi:hypothetical protein